MTIWPSISSGQTKRNKKNRESSKTSLVNGGDFDLAYVKILSEEKQNFQSKPACTGFCFGFGLARLNFAMQNFWRVKIFNGFPRPPKFS